MTRNNSKILPPNIKGDVSEGELSTLKTLGWQPFFSQQMSSDERIETPPVRIVEVHRSALSIVGEGIDETIPPRSDAAVGDWLLLDRIHPPSSRILERKSLVKRRAAGTGRQVQMIAANIDTAFIVTSCNREFNIARLERYIALAFEADITPVIVLTKADLASASQEYVDEALTISEQVSVVFLDARGDEPKAKLAKWCKLGKTVAFLGSSGVGKSTLTNALAGTQTIETQAIREDDDKGRHTTTHRQLHFVPGGCLVLDTPGIRELQLTDVASGIDDLFADLKDLSTQCKFNDCKHVTEPGCAVLKAIKNGELGEARLGRWRKLVAEEALNSAGMAQRKSKDKTVGNKVRHSIKPKAR